MQTLRNQGVDEPYVKIVEDICSDPTVTVVLHKESNKIPIKKVVRQGDTISSMLFTVWLQEVLRALDCEQLGIRVNGEYLSNMRFANDIDLLTNSGGELQSMITDLERQSRLMGLNNNMQETKLMLNSLIRGQRLAIGSEALEVVKEYICLGHVVTADPNNETEVTRRIRMGRSAFGRYSQIMDGGLPVSLKRKVHKR